MGGQSPTGHNLPGWISHRVSFSSESLRWLRQMALFPAIMDPLTP